MLMTEGNLPTIDLLRPHNKMYTFSSMFKLDKILTEIDVIYAQ